jgi:hypothetical protein
VPVTGKVPDNAVTGKVPPNVGKAQIQLELKVKSESSTITLSEFHSPEVKKPCES